MKKITFKHNPRHALQYGSQKINLHQVPSEIIPRAQNPTSGSADLCFITATPIEEAEREIKGEGVEILEGGIVEREGALGKIRSIYFRDPESDRSIKLHKGVTQRQLTKVAGGWMYWYLIEGTSNGS